jgi:hypothetical protein
MSGACWTGLTWGAARFPDGVWRVELAPLAERAVIAEALARVLGLQVPGGTAAVDAVVGHLAEAVARPGSASWDRASSVRNAASYGTGGRWRA